MIKIKVGKKYYYFSYIETQNFIEEDGVKYTFTLPLKNIVLNNFINEIIKNNNSFEIFDNKYIYKKIFLDKERDAINLYYQKEDI